MAWIWTGMAVVSVVCGAVYGRMEAVSAAALEGAGQAVRLCLSMAGMLCLWTGLMEVMDRCGLSRRLGRLFRPVLRRLLPQASPGSGDAGSGDGQCVGQSAGAGQRRPRPWVSGRPAVWHGGRRAWPATSCAGWWY